MQASINGQLPLIHEAYNNYKSAMRETIPNNINKPTIELGSKVRSSRNLHEERGKRKFQAEEGSNENTSKVFLTTSVEARSEDLWQNTKSLEVILIESSDEEEDPEEEPHEYHDPTKTIWVDDKSKDDDEITASEFGQQWKVPSPWSYARRAFPVQQDDPGGFYITLSFGHVTYDKCLIDSGASENMLPYDLYNPFRLPLLNPVEYVMELADHSTIYPLGMCEDVIVDLFGHPVQTNFLVLDTHPLANGGQPQIILGRTFMATTKAVMDFGTGVLSMQLPSKTLYFNKNGTLLQSSEDIRTTLQPEPLSFWRSSENVTSTSRKWKK